MQGIWGDIVGGLKVAGGAVATVATAGAAAPVTVPLMAQGASEIVAGHTGPGKPKAAPAAATTQSGGNWIQQLATVPNSILALGAGVVGLGLIVLAGRR